MSPTVKGLASLSPAAKRTLLAKLLRQKAGKALLNVDRLAVNVTTLSDEVRLDRAITPGTQSAELTDHPRHILLTGATGFLGAFLLRELLDRTAAEVHCLVRAKSTEAGRVRLRQTLQTYSLWHDGLEGRIVPVPGDLGEPTLGVSAAVSADLAATIDVIYHSGAFVNWILSLRAAQAGERGRHRRDSAPRYARQDQAGALRVEPWRLSAP